MTEPVKATLRHHLPDRLRATLDNPLPDRAAITSLADRLAGVAQVDEIEIRLRSGSLIVRHRGDHDTIMSALRHAGLQIEASDGSSGPADPIRDTMSRLAGADAALQRLSGGRADIWGVSFSLLMLTGLVQLGRGRIAGPALTLFGQAATLAMARPLKRFL